MKTRPILFKPFMVRAILDGHKTETRRLTNRYKMEPGDQSWVKESSVIHNNERKYKADYIMRPEIKCFKWGNSLYATKESSRLILNLTAVRQEKLGDITEAGAIAEGIGAFRDHDMRQWGIWPFFKKNKNGEISEFVQCTTPVDSFQTLWESINGNWDIDKDKTIWVFRWETFEVLK